MFWFWTMHAGWVQNKTHEKSYLRADDKRCKLCSLYYLVMRITEKERATRERNSPNETAKGSVVARCSTWPDKRKPEEGLEKSPHNRDIDHFVEEDTQLGPRGASYVPLTAR